MTIWQKADSKHGNIADLELIEMPEKIDRLSEQDKQTVKAVLDTFILKSRFQELAVG